MSQLTHQDSSKFNGQASLCPPEAIPAQSSKDKRRYVRWKLYQLKAQRTNVAVSARNYTTAKFKGQISLCPPETISAQSSKGKCRYVRQKLCQLKAQWSNVAMSTRNYISSKFNGQTSLCRVSHPCRVDPGTQYKK